MGGRHKRRVGKEGGDDAAGDEEEQPEWEQEETNLRGHRPDPRAVQNKHWTTYYKASCARALQLVPHPRLAR